MNLKYYLGFVVSLPLLPIMYLQGKKIRKNTPKLSEARNPQGYIKTAAEKTLKILAIGESMDPGFPTTLFEGTNFTLLDDAERLDATLKLGVQWKNWRNKEFTSYMHPPYYAMHFNNGKLKEFCFEPVCLY